MKIFRLEHAAVALVLGLPLLAFAAERQVVDIAVKGMTCPFCAYGVEKNLGKASEVDVRIVLKPGAQADLDRYKQLIHDAGFTPGEAKVSKEEVK